MSLLLRVIWIYIFHRLDWEIPQHHQDIVKDTIRGTSETKQATGIEPTISAAAPVSERPIRREARIWGCDEL